MDTTRGPGQTEGPAPLTRPPAWTHPLGSRPPRVRPRSGSQQALISLASADHLEPADVISRLILAERKRRPLARRRT